MTLVQQCLKRAAFALVLVVMAGAIRAGNPDCPNTLFSDDFDSLPKGQFGVVLTISELGARSASFQINGGEIVTATSDGRICVPGLIQVGQPYLLSVTEQPVSGTVCAADEPKGIVDDALNLTVTCDLTRTDWNDFSWDQTHWN